MVSPTTILILLSAVAFFVFGGSKLLSPAFETFREDIGAIKVGITEQVTAIRAKSEAGKTGETVG